MLDNELFKILIAIIEAGEPAFGICPSADGTAGIPVYQSYQPNMQGIPTGPCAFLSIIPPTTRVGFPGRSDVWDETNEIMVHTETQLMETTFQLDTLATQNPRAVLQYTASDILNILASILQSDNTVAQLEAQDINIERISTERPNKFLDDRGRWEYSPSLDFVIAHKQVVTSTIPVIQSTKLQIFEV